MIALGYPRTWRTRCFLPGGCGLEVFAHTSGNGDFVLFDKLGSPWPVHFCYEHRITSPEQSDDPARAAFLDELKRRRGYQPERPSVDARSFSVDERTIKSYEKELPAGPQDIEQMSAIDYIGKEDFLVIGYVQEIRENAVSDQLRALERAGIAGGTLIEGQVRQRLHGRNAQITVIDESFRSFTFYANTSDIPLARRDSVCVTLRAERPLFPQFTGRHLDHRVLRSLFLAQRLERIPRIS